MPDSPSLALVTQASQEIGSTGSRLEKVALIATVLRTLDESQVPIAIAYLSGNLPQGRIGIGWANLTNLPAAANESEVQLREVDAVFSRVQTLQGPRSTVARREVLTELFARCREDEQYFLVRLLTGELRQGALGGVMAEAVARVLDLPLAGVRRVAMTGGGLAAAWSSLRNAPSEHAAGIELLSPVLPMLAKTAPSIDAAMKSLSHAVVQWKLDGVRIQVHKMGDLVRIYSRSGQPLDGRMPEIETTVRALPSPALVLDGEAICLRADGRPRPFQETGSRVSSEGEGQSNRFPLTPYFFDLLHCDGQDLIDLPLARRLEIAAQAIPIDLWVPQTITSDATDAQTVLTAALAMGHEGVVAKGLHSPYEAGRRGSSWIKVKPHHTLDLVVLAAEWGHGRRKGLLSNLHLGARDASGGFVMLGKTFKGLTDAMLKWQTERFLELQTEANQWVVHVRPEQVVEVAFDGLQASRRYPGGLALRFARVVRYRDDKTAEEADTIGSVRAIYEQSTGGA